MAAHAICFDVYYWKQPTTMAALPPKALANTRPPLACNSKNVKFLLPLQDFGKVSSRIGEGEGEMNISATLTSDMVNNVPFLHAPQDSLNYD